MLGTGVGGPASKGRAAVKDVVDRTAENDPEYQKIVKEIQQGAARNFLMGASDRQDLQYIADFRDAEHQKEMEVHQMEANEFAHFRSRLEGPEPGAGGPRTVQLAVREKKEIKPADKLLPVKVLSGRGSSELRVLKKARTTSTEITDAVLPSTHTISSAGNLAASAAAAAISALGSCPHQRQCVSGVDGVQQNHTDRDTLGSGTVQEDSGAGLQGLLGAYGSSDESDDGDDGTARAGKAAAAEVNVLTAGASSLHRLPSAAELLGGLLEDPPPAALQAAAVAQGQAALASRAGAAPTLSSSSDGTSSEG